MRQLLFTVMLMLLFMTGMGSNSDDNKKIEKRNAMANFLLKDLENAHITPINHKNLYSKLNTETKRDAKENSQSVLQPIQVFSSDDPNENTGLEDYGKITDTIQEEENMMNMEPIEVMEENKAFIPLDHDYESKIQPKKEDGRKRPNKRRESINTVIYLLNKFCGFGSKHSQRFISSLIFQFLDAPMPDNGVINFQGTPTIMNFSSNYHWLVTAGSDFTIIPVNKHFIKIWSLKDGSLKYDLDPAVLNPPGVYHFPHTCLFTSDSQRLISANDLFVQIWSVTTGNLIHTFPQSNSTTCILSPDDKYALWDIRGEDDVYVYMWSLETFANVGIFRVGRLSNFCCRGFFWMKFRELITCGIDQIIRVWDVETQKCKRKLIGHINDIRSCSLSQHQQFLASIGGVVRIWNIDTAENIQTFHGHAKTTECSFVNDDKWVASVGFNETMYLWRVEDGNIVHTFSNIDNISFRGRYCYSTQSYWVHINKRSESNENLLLSSRSTELPMELLVVDVESGRTTFTFNVNHMVYRAKIMDDRILMYFDIEDNTIRFWNLENEVPTPDHQDENEE